MGIFSDNEIPLPLNRAYVLWRLILKCNLLSATWILFFKMKASLQGNGFQALNERREIVTLYLSTETVTI